MKTVKFFALLAPLSLATLASASAQEASSQFSKELIEKGRYLATASDCVACHTNHDGGKPMAGGLPMASPVGTIMSTNITPSKEFGIGSYSEAQFSDAVRKGIRGDGANLYPAMPYVVLTFTTVLQLIDEISMRREISNERNGLLIYPHEYRKADQRRQFASSDGMVTSIRC